MAGATPGLSIFPPGKQAPAAEHHALSQKISNLPPSLSRLGAELRGAEYLLTVRARLK